jgi:hypothetical protein
MAPKTGTHAVLATLEDYLDLVACLEADLPRLTIDPNPYWTTGRVFFNRPALKQGYTRRLCVMRNLLAAEMLDVSTEKDTERLTAAGETALLANHHDYVTETGA